MAPSVGMVIGTLAVLIYVVVGGFLAVALTDFIQMIVLVIGMSIIAFFAADLAGGAGRVFDMAQHADLWRLWPEPTFTDIIFFFAAAITMMFGSIPQQDVFQRVMSAKDAPTARTGAVIGGASYILFGFVPMFIVAAAVVVMGDNAMDIAKNDYQRLLPTFVMTKMPLIMQILFFGALLSAIKSTSSATLLAPSTSFTENILKNIRPGMSDKQQLFAMRVTIVVFAALVLSYAIAMEGTSIYELVSSAYQVTLVAAFVPLVMGLYWKRATTQGAILSIGAGLVRVDHLLPADLDLGREVPGAAGGLAGGVCGHVHRFAGAAGAKNRDREVEDDRSRVFNEVTSSRAPAHRPASNPGNPRSWPPSRRSPTFVITSGGATIMRSPTARMMTPLSNMCPRHTIPTCSAGRNARSRARSPPSRAPGSAPPPCRSSRHAPPAGASPDG